MNMDTDHDPISGATYRRLTTAAVARTIHVTDVIMVDVDEHGEPVGLEYAVAPSRLTLGDVTSLLRAFPHLRGALPETGVVVATVGGGGVIIQTQSGVEFVWGASPQIKISDMRTTRAPLKAPTEADTAEVRFLPLKAIV